MRSPGIALALLLLAAASARAAQTPQSTPAPHPSNTSHLAQVDHCPLHVVSFMLVARGESGTLDRYVVALLLNGRDPVSANLAIPGLKNDILTPVVAPSGDKGQTISHYVIDIPRADNPTGMSVLGVLINGSTDREITCRQSVQLARDAPATALGSFDDSALGAGDLLFMQSVIEARVLHSGPALYSATPEQRKQASDAVIAVTVGAHGTILNTRVAQSSGVASFDASAVSAARQIVFSEPLFNGAPIPLEYLMTYRFSQ
ncbi:MAG TPA: energy transducer TonB [Candidatus Binatus sp.]|nr:energy transducer TonB [Candidatus Binatus sp.]